MIVVVTDEAGDDGEIVDEPLEPTLRKRFLCTSLASRPPWGQTIFLAKDPECFDHRLEDDSLPSSDPNRSFPSALISKTGTPDYATPVTI